jgi:hypothetical protein
MKLWRRTWRQQGRVKAARRPWRVDAYANDNSSLDVSFSAAQPVLWWCKDEILVSDQVKEMQL